MVIQLLFITPDSYVSRAPQVFMINFSRCLNFFLTPNKFPEINNDFGFSPLRGMSQWVLSNYLQSCFFLTFAVFYHTKRETLHSNNRTHAQRGYPYPPFSLHEGVKSLFLVSQETAVTTSL